MPSGCGSGEIFTCVYFTNDAPRAFFFTLPLYAPSDRSVAQIQMTGGQSVLRGANGREYLLEEEQRGEEVGHWPCLSVTYVLAISWS